MLATTVDLHLTDALGQVLTYFTTNINPVIAAVVGIAMFVWFLKFALRSFGITSISAGIFDDGDEYGVRFEARYEDDDDDDGEKYYGKTWDL
jgi:hypothetical protein